MSLPILEIAASWSYWDKPVPPSVSRDVALPDALRETLCLVIQGVRRIAGAAGIAVETAQSWIEACEAAYLLFACPWFAYSERKRAARNVKYYPVDTALRRVVVTRSGEDRGKSLECAVHLALRRRFGQVYYWRDKGEVDFVVLQEGKILPVQVTGDEPTDRHFRALEAFYEEYPQADEAVIVSASTFESEIGRIVDEPEAW